MNCLKCGKETTDAHVFCDSCLAVMEQYPVKSGTAIHLPHREPPVAGKRRKRPATPEEQIEQLKKLNQRLLIGLMIAALAFGLVSGVLAYRMLNEKTPESFGRNYTIDITPQD